jgi:hypothetical protein
MKAERRPRRHRLILVGAAAAVVAAVAVVAVLHLTTPRHDDCAVAADVISTWRSMTVSVDEMLDGGGDQLLAAFTESATADLLRSKAGVVASPHIRADVIGLADALETIARSHRAAIASHQDPATRPDPQYIKGSQDAVAAAAALRMACPSIPTDRTTPPASG